MTGSFRWPRSLGNQGWNIHAAPNKFRAGSAQRTKDRDERRVDVTRPLLATIGRRLAGYATDDARVLDEDIPGAEQGEIERAS